jgi:autotransporter passenger strand-loop-strand repeat protein
VTKATTINAGGQEFVSRGTASGSTINKGGLEVVASGGTASGTTIAGGKLDLQSGAVASGSITFAGLGTLVLEGALPAIPQTFSSPLVNVAAGDVIDLKGLAYSSAVKATVVGSTLSVTSGTVSETFNLQNFMGSGFIASSDGSGGTNLTAVVLPAIAGTHASTTADEATIQPFTGVTITDANPGGIDALTIQLSGGGGTLTGQGLTYNGNGTYVLTATTPSTLTAELDALAFTPTNTTPGSQATTTFTLTDVSNAGTTVTTATTSVTDTAVPSVTFDPTTAGFANADTPVLTGTVSANAKGVELYGNGENLGAATLNGNGTWTFKGNIGAGDFADLTAVAIDAAGHSSSAAARYELVTGVTGEPYRAIEYDYTPDGSYAYTEFGRNGGDLASAADNGDGTHTMEAYAGGQVLTSIYDDVMTGDGPSERFVFSPHFGQDEITDFNVAGAGHDVVDLSNTRFSSLVEVLQHTTMSFGSATIHLNPHDSITLDGVTKAQLKAHPHDFALA